MQLKSKEKKNKLTPLSIVMLVLLALYCLSIFYALFWTLITSFKVDKNVFDIDKFGLPNYAFYESLKSSKNIWERLAALSVMDANADGGAMFYSYRKMWEVFSIRIEASMTAPAKEVTIPQMYLNSFLYAFGCAITNTIVPCVTAYLCARYNYKFSKIIRGTVIVVMVIPIIGSMPSEISLVKSLGLMDKVYGLWIMKANFLGLYFLVFYDIFKAMPMAFSEAAKIDGASNWQIMMQIAMPLAKNTIFTILLIHFVEFWNDYQAPMVYMGRYPTISRGLNIMIQGNLPIYEIGDILFDPNGNAPAQMAAVVYTALPVTVLFLAFQKRLMGNLTMGGVKG